MAALTGAGTRSRKRPPNLQRASVSPHRSHLRALGSTTGRPTRTAADRARSSRAVLSKDASRLTLLTAGLVVFGLVMVLSASPVVSIAQYGSPWSLFERQVMWTVIGVVGFLLAQRFPLERWRGLALPFLGFTVFLLLAVLAPGIGKVAGGSSRWIGAGPIKIQPSEIAKLAFAIFAADLVARRANSKEQFREIVRPVAFVLALAGLLILKQPDMGTAIVLVCIASAILFAGGIEARLLGMVVGLIVATGSIIALAAPYRRDRLLSFINPFAHASNTGYQVVQSLVALGSGHLTGTGIGGSVAKWGLLPNAQTDFIFAVIGNEFGLIGAVLVVAAFLGFGWLGLRIALRSDDRFARYLAAGLTCWVVCQALINIGGVIGVLPETGIPLPFLSFGGSSLVVVLVATGILTRIARTTGSTSVKIPGSVARERQRTPVRAR